MKYNDKNEVKIKRKKRPSLSRQVKVLNSPYFNS